MPIPVFRPSYSDKEAKYILDTLQSGWWGSGPRVAEFEEKFAKRLGAKHCVALNSCTSALHLAGQILELPPDSEVITTPLSFISTPYFAEYHGLKIVFADVEPDTLNIDPEDVKRKITAKTKVILPVHYGGHACDMDALMELADKYKLFIIEDCAHASGSYYKGKPLGTFSDMACFSFQAVKNLAMGDGGCIITDNHHYAQRAKVLRWTGINKDTSERATKDMYSWDYEVTDLGYKFQLSDIHAAIGLAQLERLDDMNEKRKSVVQRYNKAFKKIKEIKTPVVKSYATSSYHNYMIQVDNRDELINYLKAKGISSTVHYKPLYKHKVFRHLKADCPVAEKVWKKIALLPVFPDMTDEEVNKVIDAVTSFYKGE